MATDLKPQNVQKESYFIGGGAAMRKMQELAKSLYDSTPQIAEGQISNRFF